MKRLIFLLLVMITASICTYGQMPNEPKFSATALKGDLAYLQNQLYTVHVDPYTEFSRAQYDLLFSAIDKKLTDSLTATAFLKLIKPVIAHLCDEHAQVYLPEKLLWASYQHEDVFLPITLTKRGNTYRVEKVLSTGSSLNSGDIITKIDNKPIAELLDQCALLSSGYADQRLEKALMQFGYLYTWTLPGVQKSYVVKTADGRNIVMAGVSLKTWKDELNKQTGWDNACNEAIAYQKIGNAGYVTACSFNIPPKQIDSIQKKISAIFEQVNKDNPQYLFIDISKNSGGQSVVGRMLIDGFNNKPYAGFSSNFKRSQDYINLLKSWKVEADDYYKQAPEGKVFHFSSDTTFPPEHNDKRFKGKVFIIVGNGTFSSAMMMATWIKDNHLAIIAGETPMIGHPNGFGELYNTKLPNTKINLLFGVKQWIRPSGDLKNNLLLPDLKVTLTDDKAQLIKSVLNASR
ncbi:hypothetical protein KXD93_07705 [Mucilaginibacter sp. BJC16-A38]|uniref:S41 family peptidase n=1 Tax=Mucilaginibacter phenanthrenivorans TaxID=1234842 RepID=UPI0021575632|nr:S41 family peptidase [Mucilaginibacter phenanthrenivorans]MCR8557521.1 hypothetical protein [Mucilaginibacter phenanthrenivorans]